TLGRDHRGDIANLETDGTSQIAAKNYLINFCSGIRIRLWLTKQMRVAFDRELEDFIATRWSARVDSFEHRAFGVLLTLDKHALIKSGSRRADVRQSAQLIYQLPIVLDRLTFFEGKVEVCGARKNLCLKLLSKSGHHR